VKSLVFHLFAPNFSLADGLPGQRAGKEFSFFSKNHHPESRQKENCFLQLFVAEPFSLRNFRTSVCVVSCNRSSLFENIAEYGYDWKQKALASYYQVTFNKTAVTVF
jgi:hypothetical protein